jgi:hypothetical protein
LRGKRVADFGHGGSGQLRLFAELRADDPAFLKAVAKALKPGGWLVIYHLSPAPNAPDKPYRPMVDGRSPFSAEDLAAGFETLVRDGMDDQAARALGAALGWDKPPVSMKLEDDLFALVTVARKKPLAG